MALKLPARPWRRCALGFSIAAFLSFAINFFFILWATSRRGNSIWGGLGTILEQDCSMVKLVNTMLHLVINVISVILLAGSNYCMQCLMAPNRSQIDAAHREGKWLDIGVPSVRNFFRIPRRKKIIWILLGLSSLPLHLFYNSAVLASVSVNGYQLYALTESELASRDTTKAEGETQTSVAKQLYDLIELGKLENISIEDSLREYSKPYQSKRGSLVFILDDSFNISYTGLRWNSGASWPPNYYQSVIVNFAPIQQRWICEGSNDPCADVISAALENSQDWINPFYVDIKQIYSQQTDEHCKLLFSPHLCWVVTFFNLLKGCLMLFVAFSDHERPILTVGDAVASFLRIKDACTRGMCLKSRAYFSTFNSTLIETHVNPGPVELDGTETLLQFDRVHELWNRELVAFYPTPIRKMSGASPRRWAFCIVWCLIALTTAVSLLIWGLTSITATYRTNADIQGWGLGTIQSETLVSLMPETPVEAVMLGTILVVNLPQVVLSSCYVALNSIFTALSVAMEWNNYGTHRKGLRVTSKPVGAQRSTYFLQLPYRFSLPLIIFSGTLHWLISQSLFVVLLEVYSPIMGDAFNLQSYEDLSIVYGGWSPLGIILTLVVGCVMLGFLLACAWPHLPYCGMPVAGSCSAAIAAACHLEPYQPLAWEKPVMWGAVPVDEGKPGHCSFSSEEVEEPKSGLLYH